eukprot:3499471-Rhodomonas_salina.1
MALNAVPKGAIAVQKGTIAVQKGTDAVLDGSGRATPIMHRYFPHTKECSAEDFYRAVNIVKPSLIRVDADEVSLWMSSEDCCCIVVANLMKPSLRVDADEVYLLSSIWKKCQLLLSRCDECGDSESRTRCTWPSASRSKRGFSTAQSRCGADAI